MRLSSVFAMFLAGCICASSAADARNEESHRPIADILNDIDFKAKLGNDVSYHFGSDMGPPGKNLGEYTTNRSTNAFGKSDETSCKWAMLSALIALRERALKAGGNAVVGIVSDYKGNVFSSNTEYECHAGGFVTRVELRAKIIKTSP